MWCCFFHSSLGFSQCKKLGVFYYICINSYCIDIIKVLQATSVSTGVFYLIYNCISFTKIFSKMSRIKQIIGSNVKISLKA